MIRRRRGSTGTCPRSRSRSRREIGRELAVRDRNVTGGRGGRRPRGRSARARRLFELSGTTINAEPRDVGISRGAGPRRCRRWQSARRRRRGRRCGRQRGEDERHDAGGNAGHDGGRRPAAPVRRSAARTCAQPRRMQRDQWLSRSSSSRRRSQSSAPVRAHRGTRLDDKTRAVTARMPRTVPASSDETRARSARSRPAVAG
jgi:hypothetical protein